MWALLGRDARSASLEPVVSQSGGGSEERATLQKCRIARLFDNSQIVLDFVLHGIMTHKVCDNLMLGERRYQAMINAECLYRLRRQDPVFRAQYKDFVKACELAHVTTSVWQAVKWLNKSGPAYKVWQREQFKGSWRAKVRK